ncbi:MAG TPA: CHAT domain-containing protein [Thermoanaerobaculia bacterium]|jgi:hypothetical protein|nr:CHAT domain-containing protein [Thermoanaerobaculia bacterium]
MSSKIKILFLAAEPVDTNRLRLGEESREIEQKLRSAPKARSFVLISQWSVRPGDLMETLMRHRPTIVHFSGHADGDQLIFEDSNGNTQPIKAKHLADLLTTFHDTIRLVVLNACYTSEGFAELQRVIDYTVGTTSELSDRSAIRFSSCFYQALAFGNSVQTSYELAKRQVSVENLTTSEIFTLLLREGVDASEPFVRARSNSAKANKTKNFSHEEEGVVAAADSLDEAARRKAASATGGPAPVSNAQGENVRGSSGQLPAEIRESLEHFKVDHPDPRKVAFLMMRFGKTKAHKNIVTGIRKALDPLGIVVVRADDKQYHEDLFPNVLTYAYGCGFGIAVFERIEREEFNPNVALEVGYMFALKKKVCLLKDRTLDNLQADLVGKLYRVFDPLDPIATVPQELIRWLKDQGS